MSENYEFWKMAYEYEWATEDDLREAVYYGDITDVEFKQITGKDYEAEPPSSV